MFSHSAIITAYDRQTDEQRTTAYTALAQHCAVKIQTLQSLRRLAPETRHSTSQWSSQYKELNSSQHIMTCVHRCKESFTIVWLLIVSHDFDLQTQLTQGHGELAHQISGSKVTSSDTHARSRPVNEDGHLIAPCLVYETVASEQTTRLMSAIEMWLCQVGHVNLQQRVLGQVLTVRKLGHEEVPTTNSHMQTCYRLWSYDLMAA